MWLWVSRENVWINLETVSWYSVFTIVYCLSESLYLWLKCDCMSGLHVTPSLYFHAPFSLHLFTWLVEMVWKFEKKISSCETCCDLLAEHHARHVTCWQSIMWDVLWPVGRASCETCCDLLAFPCREWLLNHCCVAWGHEREWLLNHCCVGCRRERE